MDRFESNRMWGGRFERSPDRLMELINASIAFDKRLYREDIEASVAHATMLAERGIIGAVDADAICQGLRVIEGEIEAGTLDLTEELEDIHMNVEARLHQIAGAAAGRLHTARSRNDQVATDFRLWVRRRIDNFTEHLKSLIGALLDQAERSADVIMPGFTHLQSAQPVTFGHHLMAYVEMLGRDLGRFGDARKRLNESPLGAAALAGTSFPIDRFSTSRKLGFDRPMSNSLDAVSDRDFALEFVAAAAICGMHLSRLADEVVLWASPQFAFVRLSDRFSTGSSIMPQKRNPDAAELVRAKTGRLNGALLALLTVMKALPLAYSKDMQEDKEQVFDAADTLNLALLVMTGMIADLEPNGNRMHEAASRNHATATDLADWLVRELALPFREAHGITGRLVRLADERGVSLGDLPLAEFKRVCPDITSGAREVLSVEASVASRCSYGGTAPSEVRKQIASWRALIP